jgi:hypothetical protein
MGDHEGDSTSDAHCGTFAQVFGECVQITDWQRLVLRAAEQAGDDERRAIGHARARFDTDIQRFRDGPEARDIDRAALGWATTAFEISIPSGAGLMRT